MNWELSCDAENMDKQCPTSSVQSSEVCDDSQEFCAQETQEKCSLKENSSDYVCNLCNKFFVREQDLDDHIKIHLNKPHICDICYKSSTKKRYLKEHILTPSGEKLCVCNICSKSFTQKGGFKYHLLMHSGEKPHVCNICNKSFTLKGNLKKHLVTHSGEKPHVCNNCNKSFTQKGSLKRHLVTLSEGRHECNMCSKSLCNKYYLNIHVKQCKKTYKKRSSFDRKGELSSISEESKKDNYDSHLSKTGENFHENNYPGKLDVKEEIDYVVKEEHDISDEEYSYPNVGEMLIKSHVDLHEMSCDVKEENIHYEVNDVKVEYDIDYEDIVY